LVPGLSISTLKPLDCHHFANSNALSLLRTPT
jgi:hypothetical protein